MDPIRNFAFGTLVSGISNTDTTLIISDSDASKFPNPNTDGAFNVVVFNSTDYSNPAQDPDVEIVRVTASSSSGGNTTYTITRAQEGTTAKNHNTSGKTYRIILAPTKKTIDDIKTYVDKKTYIKDADADTSLDVEETSDADTIVGKVSGVECLRFHSNGILDLAKQSAVSVTSTAIQTIPSGTWTKKVYNSEIRDIQNEFDSSINYRWTATKPGVYLFYAFQRISCNDGNTLMIRLNKNGYAVGYAWTTAGATSTENTVQLLVSPTVSAGDYFEVEVYQNSGSNQNAYETEVNCRFIIVKIA